MTVAANPIPEPDWPSPYRRTHIEGVWSGNPIADTSWMAKSRCTRPLWPLFVSEDAAERNKARTVCPRCPVRKACLLYAVWWPQEGVWGGVWKVDHGKVRRILIAREEQMGAARNAAQAVREAS